MRQRHHVPRSGSTFDFRDDLRAAGADRLVRHFADRARGDQQRVEVAQIPNHRKGFAVASRPGTGGRPNRAPAPVPVALQAESPARGSESTTRSASSSQKRTLFCR